MPSTKIVRGLEIPSHSHTLKLVRFVWKDGWSLGYDISVIAREAVSWKSASVSDNSSRSRSELCVFVHEWAFHYSDVMMSARASHITGVSIVYSTVCSGADQGKYQSSASLTFVRGIHRWPVNSPHKGLVTRKVFPFDDVIMISRLEPDFQRGRISKQWTEVMMTLCVLLVQWRSRCDLVLYLLNLFQYAYIGLILGWHPANERRRYKVTPCLIGWAQAYNQPWYRYLIILPSPSFLNTEM